MPELAPMLIFKYRILSTVDPSMQVYPLSFFAPSVENAVASGRHMLLGPQSGHKSYKIYRRQIRLEHPPTCGCLCHLPLPSWECLCSPLLLTIHAAQSRPGLSYTLFPHTTRLHRPLSMARCRPGVFGTRDSHIFVSRYPSVVGVRVGGFSHWTAGAHERVYGTFMSAVDRTNSQMSSLAQHTVSLMVRTKWSAVFSRQVRPGSHRLIGFGT